MANWISRQKKRYTYMWEIIASSFAKLFLVTTTQKQNERTWICAKQQMYKYVLNISPRDTYLFLLNTGWVKALLLLHWEADQMLHNIVEWGHTKFPW